MRRFTRKSDVIEWLEDCTISSNCNESPTLKNLILEDVTETNRDDYYLMLLIDAALDANIYTKELKNTLLNILIDDGRNHSLKLTILDYLLVHKPLNELDVDSLNKILNKRQERLIVKNQVILLLMVKFGVNKYWERLKDQLSRTRAYQAHLRLYNTVMNERELYKGIGTNQLNELCEISLSNQTGQAVKQKVQEVKLFYEERNG